MFLEVSIGNQAALALYGKLGFQPVGRRRAYYSSGEDALILKACLAYRNEAEISPDLPATPEN